MNTKGFKQMLIGEKMPDKDDPKYKERYERDVRAGRKFVIAIIPRALPWARSFCPFRAYGAKQLGLNSLNESRKRQRNFGFMCQKV